MLQNLGGACKERRCEIRVEILTDINECCNKELLVVKGVIDMTYERCEAFRGSQTLEMVLKFKHRFNNKTF